MLAVEVIALKILTYRAWSDTCTTLHEVLQMMGKAKLASMAPQPEWGHVVLHVGSDGFSTGYVPLEGDGFEIGLSVADARVEARSALGDSASFSIAGRASVSDLFHRFLAMLEQIGHPLDLNPLPQEMAITTPFDEQRDAHDFDTGSMRRSFRQFLFARSALERFSAPYRGKRTLPSLYWGTFDLTTTLYSGAPCPFDPAASLIERAAFDEQMVEFGFWPGDERVDDPSFFALAYPFLEEGDSADISIRGARFDAAAAQYLLPLEAVVSYDDPEEAVVRFCRDAFDAVASRQRWRGFEWLTKPLLRS